MGGLTRALLLALVFSLSFKNGQVFGRLRLAEYLLLPLGFYVLLMRRLVEPGFRWRRTALQAECSPSRMR